MPLPDAPDTFSPAREGGVGRLHVTGTLIPALTGGADSRRFQPQRSLGMPRASIEGR
jgi:hypothetical protein